MDSFMYDENKVEQTPDKSKISEQKLMKAKIKDLTPLELSKGLTSLMAKEELKYRVTMDQVKSKLGLNSGLVPDSQVNQTYQDYEKQAREAMEEAFKEFSLQNPYGLHSTGPLDPLASSKHQRFDDYVNEQLKKYGPVKVTRTASPLGGMSSLEELVRKNFPVPRTTASEELLDELFDQDEKKKFLIDMGYKFFKNKDNVDVFKRDNENQVYTASTDIDLVFYMEMKIKLKNVLLTKQVLKFKI